MKNALVFLFFLVGFAQVDSAPVPVPFYEADSMPSVKGMVWNKWETDNFVILSIGRSFGDAIRSEIEDCRSELCVKWGVADVGFPVKCKVVCVSDPSMLKQFFSLDAPKFEVRRDSAGNVSELVVWIDEERSSSLEGLLAYVCLHDSSVFLKRGVPAIVGLSAEQISDVVLSSSSLGSAIFFVSDSDLKSLDPKQLSSIDGESVVACLFLRREFGDLAFSAVASGASPESVCGFADRDSMMKSFQRYSDNLKSDLKSGRTPYSYLKP